MDGLVIHASFDVLAWIAAGAAALWLTRTGRVSFPVPQPLRLPYLAALVFGAGVGAVAFGTVNLWLSGLPGVARSIEGAVAGAILAIEIYKRMAGITLRTGARFALPFAVGVAVGRVGCYLSGLEDSPTARRPACPGRTTSATACRAIRCSSTRAPQWRLSRACTSGACCAATASSSRTASISRSAGTDCNASPGNSSSRTGRCSARSRCSHLLSAVVLLYAIVMIATAPKSESAHERAFA